MKPFWIILTAGIAAGLTYAGYKARQLLNVRKLDYELNKITFKEVNAEYVTLNLNFTFINPTSSRFLLSSLRCGIIYERQVIARVDHNARINLPAKNPAIRISIPLTIRSDKFLESLWNMAKTGKYDLSFSGEIGYYEPDIRNTIPVPFEATMNIKEELQEYFKGSPFEALTALL